MPRTKGPIARVIALGGLLVVLGVALRGRLPGVQQAEPDRPAAGGPAPLIGVIALVSAATLVVAVAIVMSIREPGRPMPAARYDVPGGGAPRGRRSWRMLLIGLAAILAWLLLNALLTQLRWPESADVPSPPTTPGPAPNGEPVPRPPVRQPGGADDHVFWFLAASTAALMVLILTAAVVVRVRRRRYAASITAPAPAPADGADVSEPASGSESLALAAERGLAEVGDLSREPREAIIACYAAMENALANAPGAAPQDSDTPSEVLARAVEHQALQSGSATELVTLFAEARFSTHVMNEGHRETAERALRLVLDELRSSV
ncbi:MAG TPA: DUF4129 domain-containing protein [Mycobacterium sp.]